MNRLTDSRTRVVTWLKLVLPLVALGLLSTLFLLARTTDPDLAIRYSEVDVTELSKEQQVTAPTYAGITRDGASIRITASTVRPRSGNAHELDAQSASGHIAFRAGASADMAAPAAEVDTESNLARFTGGVTMVASDGHRVATETLQAALGMTEIVAETPVRVSGPLGTLDAASMRITQDEAGGYVAVFNGGVRLIYDPTKPEE
jgi:lipopolysaccharide export system protein LptC